MKDCEERRGLSTRRVWARLVLGIAAGACFGLLGASGAAAVDFCAFGANPTMVPEGHIVYNVRVNQGACPTGSNHHQFQTRVPLNNNDWAYRPINFDYEIPSGMIVAQVQTSWTFGVVNGPGWRVALPNNGDWVCAVWNSVAIPTGFVVTAVNQAYSQCDAGSTDTAYQISTPNPTSQWTCKSGTAGNWDMPPNFVVVEIDNRPSTCQNGSFQLGWRISNPLVTGGSDINVCLPSTVPPGWIHETDIISLGPCGVGGASGSGFRISPAEDGGITCDPTSVPTNFVIEEVLGSSVCGTGYRLANLNVRTGETRACVPVAAPPPPSHVVVERKDYAACADPGSGFGYMVKVPSTGAGGEWTCQGAPIPSNFIINQVDPNRSRCGNSGGRGEHIVVPQAGTTYWACGNSPIPAGFFAIAEGSPSICNNEFSRQIGPVADNAVTCNPAQIPPEYATIEIFNSSQCGGGPSYRVLRPNQNGSTQPVCTGSNTPPGFVWVATLDHSQCNAFGIDRTIKVPDPTVGVPTNVCQSSPIPSGFVITGFGDWGACTGSTAADFTIAVPNPNGTTVICSTSNLPSNFVITSVDNYGQCGGNVGAVIEFPEDTGTTIICNPSEVPAGYEIVAQGTYSPCGPNNSGGPGKTIQRIDAGVEPTTFIGTEPDVTSPPGEPDPEESCPTGVPANPTIAGTVPKNQVTCQW